MAYCFSLRRLVTSSLLHPREQKIQIFKEQKVRKCDLYILIIFTENLKCFIHLPTFKTEDIDYREEHLEQYWLTADTQCIIIIDNHCPVLYSQTLEVSRGCLLL